MNQYRDVLDQIEHTVEDVEHEFEDIEDDDAPESVREKQKQVHRILDEIHGQLKFLEEHLGESGKD